MESESAERRVVLTIGLPGAGKSAWFRERGIVPLSSDSLRLLLADDEQEQRFQEQIFRALRELLAVRLEIGRPRSWIDATNLLRLHRRPLIETALAAGSKPEALFFDVPLRVCLERNRRRQRRVPDEIVRKMAAALEPPSLEEGFSRIVVVGGEDAAGKITEAVLREP